MSLVVLKDGYIELNKSGDKNILSVGNYETEEHVKIEISKDKATEIIELLNRC